MFRTRVVKAAVTVVRGAAVEPAVTGAHAPVGEDPKRDMGWQ
ncbi:hypothetical protein [Streptomyces sp. NBC_01012]|nr:hypothetical protein OG623_22705 [Streptomyces sp. NBC_01012]